MATKRISKTKSVRVGVVGVGRGQSFMQGAGPRVGLKLVAICDRWQARLEEVGRRYGVATYTDYDAFLAHDMDAVILANYFHEHAPFAIRALEAGRHVMSECTCNATLGEGVALCRAVEKSGRIYMLAENAVFTAFNMEMARVYRTGEIGDVTYAEGEYNHPMPARARMTISPGLEHWRWWMPSTYYCTHALGPLMAITNTMPVRVNGLSVARSELEADTPRVADPGSVILCRMDNGAVFKILGLHLPGHSNWYRVHGTRGAMELVRGPGYYGPGQIRVWHEEWMRKPDEPADRTYVPDWPEHADLARQAGHGGGDFWTSYEFANAIRSGKQPYLDVYRGVAMSSVGILAWKSALANGAPLDMPDFRSEAARAPYAGDNYSPFPSHWRQGYGRLPASILGTLKPSKKGVAAAKEVWKEMGYPGK
ncbi:MAG: Gfo/Idh/MocA family oxidoreductase [bacterium]|nr:Gfo/Idh/MocA family oxidoreductase [bacterium]